jgi:hypothetical protein
MKDDRDEFIPFWLQTAMPAGSNDGIIGQLAEPVVEPWNDPRLATYPETSWHPTRPLYPFLQPPGSWDPSSPALPHMPAGADTGFPAQPAEPVVAPWNDPRRVPLRALFPLGLPATFSPVPPLEHLDSGKYWPVAPAPLGANEQPSRPASSAAPMTPPEQVASPQNDGRRGVLARTIEGFTAGAGTAPLGFTPQHRAQYPMLQALQPFAAPIDLALRLPAGVIGGAAGVGAGLAENFGLSRAQADRLQRDLGLLGQSAMVAVPARPRQSVPRPVAGLNTSEAPPGGISSFPAPPTTQNRLFDFSRLHEVPNVPQFDLERYVPPRGVPHRVQSLASPTNIERVNDAALRGADQGGRAWYNTEPLGEAFIGLLGPEKGLAAYEQYLNFVAATSPRSSVGENIRNASYYYVRSKQEPTMPVPHWDGSKLRLDETLPPPYGHTAQGLHAKKVNEVLEGGSLSPLTNPKISSFAENLRGNQMPVTIDAHNARLWGLRNARGLPADVPPQAGYGFLERLQQAEAGKLGLTPAQYQASAWIGGANQTGVRSNLAPWLESFEERVALTAQKHGMSKEEVLRQFIRGELSLLSLGGIAAAEATLPRETEDE